MSGLRSHAVAAAVAAVVAAAGCANLPDPGVCGNRLTETALGEACDDGGDTALCTAACQLKCVAVAVKPGDYVEVGVADVDDDDVDEAVFCPAGSACGADLLCRRPSGLFASASGGIQLAFDAGQLEVVDTNGDGIDDLLGISATTLRIRYGAADQPLVSAFAASAPPVNGQSALVDVTDDGTIERALLVPSLGGLVQYRFHDGAPIPELALAFQITNGTELPGALRALPRIRGVLRGAPALGNAQLSVVIPTGGRVESHAITAAGVNLEAGCDTTHATALTNGTAVMTTPDDWNSFAVGVTSLVPLVSTICHFVPATPQWRVTATTVPSLAYGVLAGAGNVVFADVNGDSCRDLVFTATTSLGAEQILYIGLVPNAGACVPGGPPIPLAVVGGASGGVVLAAGRVGGGARDELVTSEGVFQIGAGPLLARRYQAPRAWSSASVADVDGDGRNEVVAVSITRDDVDVVRFSPINGAPSVYRADTLRPAVFVVTADLDGDFVQDVAVIEEGESGHAVSVLYGDAGGVLGEPIAMGDFEGRLSVARVPRRNFGSVLDRDAVDDLGVVIAPSLAPADPYPLEVAAGFLYGGPSRRLISPEWAPAQLMPPQLPPDEIRGVVGLVGEAPRRVALFADRQVPGDPTVCPVGLPGAPDAIRNLLGATWWDWSWDGDVAVETYVPGTSNYQCGDLGGGARLAAGVLAGTEVIAVADAGTDENRAVLRVLSQPAGCSPAWKFVKGEPMLPYGTQRPRSIAFHDLTEGAGDEVLLGFERVGQVAPQLVIAAAPPAGPPGVCPFPDQLVLDVGAAIGAAERTADHHCTAGVVLPVVVEDEAGAVTWTTRLVAACSAASGAAEADRAALFLLDPRARLSPTELAPGAASELVRTIGEARDLVVGDVNGDGLDDLVLQVLFGAQLQVEVFTQCAAHDTAACDDGHPDDGGPP